MIISMNEAEKKRLKLAAEAETEENMSDVIDNCVLSEDDDMEEIPKGKVRRENDISDLLPVSMAGWLSDSLVHLAEHLTGFDSALARVNYLQVLLILTHKWRDYVS